MNNFNLTKFTDEQLFGLEAIIRGYRINKDMFSQYNMINVTFNFDQWRFELIAQNKGKVDYFFLNGQVFEKVHGHYEL